MAKKCAGHLIEASETGEGFHHQTTRTLSGPASSPSTFVPPNSLFYSRDSCLVFSFSFLTWFGFKVMKVRSVGGETFQSRSNSESIHKRFHWIADVMNHSGSHRLYWSSLVCVRKALLPLAVIFCLLPYQFFFKLHVWMDNTYNTIHFLFLCRTSIKCQLSFPMQI